MTPNAVRGQFYCSRGHSGRHGGRYSVSEALLLDWAEREAARFHPPVDAVELGSPDRRRADLEMEVDRLLVQHQKGYLTEAELDARMAEVRQSLADLDTTTMIVDVPQVIDWKGWTPEAINTVLRTYWHHVELDADLRPVRALWRLPSEYVE
jgi:hypothetical protein